MPSRSVRTTPLMSVSVTFSGRSPMEHQQIDAGQRRGAGAGGDQPHIDSALPCSTSPLRTAAATVIAVPCWSSWNTGMRMRRRSSASMAKHSGALMSSRLIAPKVGSSAATTSQKRSGSSRVDLDVEHVDAGELLEQDGLALHHRLAGQRADIAQAEHGGAVGDHRRPGCRARCSRRRRAGRRRSPRRRRRRRANRPATGRAASPCAWSARSPVSPAAAAGGSPAPPCGSRRPSATHPRYCAGRMSGGPTAGNDVRRRLVLDGGNEVRTGLRSDT